MPARSRLLPLLVSAALLASCSTPDDAPPRTVTTAAAAGADAPSGTVVEEKTAVIELGEFDEEDDGFVLFDPCTEIPREVLDEAGFGDMVSDPSYLPTGSVLCSFWAEPRTQDLEMLTVVSDAVEKERVRGLNFMIAEKTNSSVEEIYTHHMGEGSEGSCTSAVATTRGRLTVMFDASRADMEEQVMCDRAVSSLEIIYFHLGENSGNPS